MKKDAASIQQTLLDALKRRFGSAATMCNVTMPTLGGVNMTVVFDLVVGGSTRRMVSRQETVDQGDNIFLPSWQQFEVLN